MNDTVEYIYAWCLCRSVKKIFAQITATLNKQIGKTDLIVFFINTDSHKMIRCTAE